MRTQSLERKFIARRELWAAAVEAIAVLDALMALAGALTTAKRFKLWSFIRHRRGCICQLHLPALHLLAAPTQTPSHSHNAPGAAVAGEGIMCRPTVLDALPSTAATAAASDPTAATAAQPAGPFFHAAQLRHPAGLGSGGSFVPNDVRIGGGGPRLLLLTGPNMGGKSTLLRQVCLATVLAQVSG